MSEQNGAPIVGFDLGHGETALALTYAGRTAPPAVLDLPGASGAGRQHVTAVNEQPDGGVVIGEAAVDAIGGVLSLAFKSPHLDREEVRRPTVLFATKVREDLVAAALLPRGEVSWVFGAPSGWPPRLRDAYAQLFRSAGFANVDVVPESRAALLYARDSGEVRMDESAIRGSVLIVDLGSSTTDFTSVVAQKDRPLDTGTALGASLIDRAIRDRVLADHPQSDLLGDAIQQDRAWRLRLELLCRKAKEDFFRLDPERVATDPHASVIRTARIDVPGGQKVYVHVELAASDVREILDTPLRELGGRSWRAAFVDDLGQAVEALGEQPDAVLLTGGASRMQFVAEIARASFGVERVQLGTEPEAAIARGLALAGRINRHAAGFLEDIASLIDGNRIEAMVTERLSDFADLLGASAANGITQRHMIPAFRKWRNGEVGTLNEVVTIVANDLQAELTDPANPAVAKAFAEWYNNLRPELQELTRPICARWHIPASAMALPRIDLSGRSWKISLTDTGAATQVLENLAKIVNVVIAGIVSTTLFGAGVALIASTGPFAVIIAFVVTWVVLNEGADAAKEKAKNIVIPVRLRQLRSERSLVARLERDASTTESALASQLSRQFLVDGGPDLSAEVTKSIATQFAALADDAKLLIS